MRGLTPFQAAALDAYAAGKTVEGVAAEIGRTPASVRSALDQARRKTGSRTSLEAAAKLEGLTRPL